MAARPSRKVLTSGGNEPVGDVGGRDGTSVFASWLVYEMREWKGDFLLMDDIVGRLKRDVATNTRPSQVVQLKEFGETGAAADGALVLVNQAARVDVAALAERERRFQEKIRTLTDTSHEEWVAVEAILVVKDTHTRAVLAAWLSAWDRSWSVAEGGETRAVAIPDLEKARKIAATWPSAPAPRSVTKLPLTPAPSLVQAPATTSTARVERRPSRSLAWGAAGSAVVAGTGFALAATFQDAFLSEPNADQASADRTANRISFVAGVTGGIAAAGLITGAVVVGRW